MKESDITTTVTHVQLVGRDVMHVLYTSNDIRENYASELCQLSLVDLAKCEMKIAKPEWLTSFRSLNAETSFVSRWDDTIYRVIGSDVSAISLPCEAITRVVEGHSNQVICTCYWGLVQWKRDDQWIAMDIGREVDLFGALSEADDVFYVCGAEGTLAKWTGSVWQFFDLATDADLFGLARHADGDIVVCGDGVVFKGNGADWHDLNPPEATYHFAFASGAKVYLCGGELGLFVLEGETISVFAGDVYAYHCDANEHAVVCCGADTVHIFAGGAHQEVVFEALF